MNVSSYILANAGKELSVDNVISAYKKNSEEVSKRTIYNYLERMKKAYLIHGVSRYNITGKSALSNREKQYAVDVGFRTINTNTINFADTFFLENIIYNELVTRGYTVFAGKTYKGEVDFVAIKGGKKCFIQVAYLLAGAETIKREFGAYSKITDASPKYVMSLDKLGTFFANGNSSALMFLKTAEPLDKCFLIVYFLLVKAMTKTVTVL